MEEAMTVRTAAELQQQYLAFFAERGHVVIPSAPLVPENDPTVLFTTAGMHPLVPNLLGELHPRGRRLVDVQKCLRTDDIDEVGDLTHNTFFQMLGNWSLGDYFKREALAWSWEFLTRVLGLDPDRISVTVFAGDQDAPRDEESATIWRQLGVPPERIYYLSKKDNWWPKEGQTGPCGPDSEMFFDVGRLACSPACRPGCPCGKYVEIWNNVFMEYTRTPNGTYVPLAQKNVDTGMGVERATAVLQGTDDVFQTDLFSGLIGRIEELTGQPYGPEAGRAMRIVADHVRAAAFLIADGVSPLNVERGYVLRRLIRRSIRYGRELGLGAGFASQLAAVVVDQYGDLYPELEGARAGIIAELQREEDKFSRTLGRGLREFAKVLAQIRSQGLGEVPPQAAFRLYDTFGFPISLTRELADEQGVGVDEGAFERLFRAHQEKSRGSAGAFKGGLADHGETTTKLHTATHLLHRALRDVLGEHVQQKGSNITPERLRFDFSHPERLSEEQVRRVEAIVNERIREDLPVRVETKSRDEALREGALAFFGERYGDVVKVYRIGGYSKEVCGGPHVRSTGELGSFMILKEEAVGQGVRRIRAIVHGNRQSVD
jgi:alanyl-tRNA synthetase